jgi:choice-of-anchor A domain-containing protein
MNLRQLLATTASVMASSSVGAAIIGPAADYNVFIVGNGGFISQNTDTQGNLAVGGDANLSAYTVAAGVAGVPQAPNPARLVVGGKLTAQNGGVGSNQAGAIYAGSTTLTSFTATGGTHAQTLMDFGAAATLYTSLSTYLGGLALNGSTSNVSGLTFTGTRQDLNVFMVSGSTLTNSNTVNISAPAGSTVLINVSGSSATQQNGMVFESGVGAANVLYNFYAATSVNLAGSKDPQGSILAPLAGVTGGYGQMNGQLIARSFSGNIQFDNVSFQGNLPSVPLPAAAWLLLTGLGGVAGLARLDPRRKQELRHPLSVAA